MLHIHQSNRLEILVQQLIDQLRTPLPNPLESEVIVVQSPGMQRWLSMTIAEQLGVCANIRFPFPRTLVAQLFSDAGLIDSKTISSKVFEREVMLWGIMAVLPQHLETKPFQELYDYLQNDLDGSKYFQLCSRIADLFDQYTLFRPEMLEAWEHDKTYYRSRKNERIEKAQEREQQWQRRLWVALTRHFYPIPHRAELWQQFIALSEEELQSRLPQRFFIFGIPSLPPPYLQALMQLGQCREIHLFLINPCREYWGDVLTNREASRRVRRQTGQPLPPEELYFTVGNPLLPSWGKMGRDFFDLLNNYHDFCVIDEQYVEPSNDSLLHCLQSDLLDLRERENDSKPADRSLQFHSCHSAMREVEVLYDQLLAMFDADPNLESRNILVMVPKIDDYAAAIEAVFATKTKHSIPFSIADRDLRSESALIDSFLAILELQHSRLTANEIMTLLENPSIQRRFELSDTDLPQLRYWVEQTAICWGMDGQSRADDWKIPALDENTWRAGLQRLLLGYALADESQLYDGILPYSDIEGQESVLLGKLVAFVEGIFCYLQALQDQRQPVEWSKLLQEMLAEFFLPIELQEAEAQAIRDCLDNLRNHSKLADFEQPIHSKVAISYLRSYLQEESAELHFLTGRVTFCAMLPMRSIPMKVVCLLGMNDGLYPRPQKPLGFDLIAKHPQKADRSVRYNDRYLFLEAVLSARDCLYISYVGQNVRDNSKLPPSVLVSELQDYLKQAFGEQTLNQLVRQHPLQPFSPHYFDQSDQQLFSYAADYCQASQLVGQGSLLSLQEFFDQALPEPDDEWRSVTLDQLCEFFRHPCRFLLEKRLGVILQEDQAALEDDEPFALNGLQNYQLQQHLVTQAMAGESLDAQLPLVKAQGVLPHGKLADIYFEDLSKPIPSFVETVQTSAGGQQAQQPTPIHLAFDDWELHGVLNQLHGEQRLVYRYANLKAKDFLQAWIIHLAMNATDKMPNKTLLIGKNAQWEYQPVADSRMVLNDLFLMYWRGLSELLHFFPESSLAYAEQRLVDDKGSDKAISEARKQWESNQYFRGEADDPHYHLCFTQRGIVPLDDRFQLASWQVLQTLLWHRVEVKEES